MSVRLAETIAVAMAAAVVLTDVERGAMVVEAAECLRGGTRPLEGCPPSKFLGLAKCLPSAYQRMPAVLPEIPESARTGQQSLGGLPIATRDRKLGRILRLSPFVDLYHTPHRMDPFLV